MVVKIAIITGEVQILPLLIIAILTTIIKSPFSIVITLIQKLFKFYYLRLLASLLYILMNIIQYFNLFDKKINNLIYF